MAMPPRKSPPSAAPVNRMQRMQSSAEMPKRKPAMGTPARPTMSGQPRPTLGGSVTPPRPKPAGGMPRPPVGGFTDPSRPGAVRSTGGGVKGSGAPPGVIPRPPAPPTMTSPRQPRGYGPTDGGPTRAINAGPGGGVKTPRPVKQPGVAPIRNSAFSDPPRPGSVRPTAGPTGRPVKQMAGGAPMSAGSRLGGAAALGNAVGPQMLARGGLVKKPNAGTKPRNPTRGKTS